MYDQKAIDAITENQDIAEQAIASADVARANFDHEHRIADGWKKTAEAFEATALKDRAKLDALLAIARRVVSNGHYDTITHPVGTCLDCDARAAIAKAEGVRS